MHANIHIYMYIYTYMHTHACSKHNQNFRQVFPPSCIECPCVFACVHMHIYIGNRICTCVYIRTNTYTLSINFRQEHLHNWTGRFYTRLRAIYARFLCINTYGVLKNISLFCNRALQKRPVFCKETCIFKHPTNRSHPIPHKKVTGIH